MENFIKSYYIDDKSLCDNLIDYFHKDNDYKDIGRAEKGANKISTDVHIHFTNKNKFVLQYNEHLSKSINEYIKCFEAFYSIKVHTQEGFNLQHYKPGEGFFNWHCERNSATPLRATRGLVFMTYLNDVTDGGETEFLYQKKKFKPKKGLTLIWPSDFTHTHRGITSKTQDKYIATGWFHYL